MRDLDHVGMVPFDSPDGGEGCIIDVRQVVQAVDNPCGMNGESRAFATLVQPLKGLNRVEGPLMRCHRLILTRGSMPAKAGYDPFKRRLAA
jgi:hypothetical protein